MAGLGYDMSYDLFTLGVCLGGDGFVMCIWIRFYDGRT